MWVIGCCGRLCHGFQETRLGEPLENDIKRCKPCVQHIATIKTARNQIVVPGGLLLQYAARRACSVLLAIRISFQNLLCIKSFIAVIQ